MWGAMLLGAAEVLADDRSVRPSDVTRAVTAARDALVRAGGAEVGDKTMLDALEPFVQTLRSRLESDGLEKAWGTAVVAARRGAEATAGFQARRGRARPLGARSLGHPDPGATSLAIVVATIGDCASADKGVRT